MRQPVFLTSALLALASQALAQGFNPPTGDWGKDDPLHLRVMTWNVQDGLASSVPKLQNSGQWEALARIVAVLQPDVLLLQETADAVGGADNVSEMNTVLDRFMHGGSDPFLGGTVTAYVQKYAPAFDLPHVFVSTISDGFNRNVVMSRYPFADLNGDGFSTRSDIPFVASSAASWIDASGTGGLRGIQVAEIDLPDGSYDGDVVVMNAHLKAGGSSSDHDQRVEAAQRASYVIEYWFNGAGTGTPDPFNKIADSPMAQNVLPAATPVIFGGDWNEDEAQNGATKGPADWITKSNVADSSGGTDGTDRDGSDMVYDSATEFFGGTTKTQGNSKLDHIGSQDSIATTVRQFVFLTNTLPGGNLPPELATAALPTLLSGIASDHRPVIVDYSLVSTPPPVICQPDLGFSGPGVALLSVCGTGLGSGQSSDIAVTSAPPLALSSFVASFSPQFLPFAGGVIVPKPDILLPFVTDGAGEYLLPGLVGGGGPLQLQIQVVVFDASQTQGFTISNAINAVFAP
ncbi:endonuclease/exonuclease/phosphatase family protein [Engelhardtia mirabilis]|uniref:Endonuclease/Exonuclease/phosphatase family protein n=1 Tax=Engelhardtia mirabilis TaxID=2528011 RepID=A0A518BIR7_9BACT|nr:Endonuclease/Exonuclease/phosphatase family protein [Planctomycetes bacterium Pla133]QDV01181.1 Endonuclease/Exonuclease/phosphatase family protein [Planctomycetes bacterium Pla86]